MMNIISTKNTQDQLTESDFEEIAKLINDGFTSGIIGNEEYRINWDLTTNKFSIADLNDQHQQT